MMGDQLLSPLLLPSTLVANLLTHLRVCLPVNAPLEDVASHLQLLASLLVSARIEFILATEYSDVAGRTRSIVQVVIRMMSASCMQLPRFANALHNFPGDIAWIRLLCFIHAFIFPDQRPPWWVVSCVCSHVLGLSMEL